MKKEVEDAKVSMRHARHSALEAFKKAPLSTDERKELEQQVGRAGKPGLSQRAGSLSALKWWIGQA